MNKRKLIFWILGLGVVGLLVCVPQSPVWKLTTFREIAFAMAAPIIVFALEIVVVGWGQSSLRR